MSRLAEVLYFWGQLVMNRTPGTGPECRTTKTDMSQLDTAKSILLQATSQLNDVTIPLPSSKSESNRALIINALSPQPGQLHNLSTARDTQTMMRLLQSQDPVLDVLDAGTTMRFLTAYLTVTNANKGITGTARMQQRPIELLVEALRTLGAVIRYEKEDGYPPMFIQGLASQRTNQVAIRGDVSSQYISALLMVAPTLPQGLALTLTGKVGSRPYIEMTLQLMKRFGARYQWEGNTITVAPQPYGTAAYTIESDWSGASYWYSMVALAQQGTLKLKGLRKESLQGDISIASMMEPLGVQSTFEADGVLLTKGPAQPSTHIDFSDSPDLAQTVAVTCAAKGITCTMTGLESLRIKETDRIAALQTELAKVGATFEEANGQWTLQPPTTPLPQQVSIDTYDDHRMAMAFAPLATRCAVLVHEPAVVKKSYPSFWDDVALAGIATTWQ